LKSCTLLAAPGRTPGAVLEQAGRIIAAGGMPLSSRESLALAKDAQALAMEIWRLRGEDALRRPVASASAGSA
jgi:hypothetical protein